MRIPFVTPTKSQLFALTILGLLALAPYARMQQSPAGKEVGRPSARTSRDDTSVPTVPVKKSGASADKAASNVRIAKGFKIDLIYSVPRATEGSWVALCVDPQGRLIAADQNGKLYRVTTPEPNSNSPVNPETIAVNLAGAHG